MTDKFLALRILMLHGSQFSDYPSAVDALEKIDQISDVELLELAQSYKKHPDVLRGALMVAKHCNDAINWIMDNNIDPTMDNYRAVIEQMESSQDFQLSKDNELFCVANGAKTLLAHVRGWSKGLKG